MLKSVLRNWMFTSAGIKFHYGYIRTLAIERIFEKMHYC